MLELISKIIKKRKISKSFRSEWESNELTTKDHMSEIKESIQF